MSALMARDPTAVPWAPRVKFTENGVSMMIGEGLWGSVRGKRDEVLRIADPDRSTIVWYGVVLEHDAPAYYGMRLKAEGGKVAEVETLVARARNPGPFGDVTRFKIDSVLRASLPAKERQTRESMVQLVERYTDMMVKGGAEPGAFDRRCSRVENGATVSEGSSSPAVVAKVDGRTARGCHAQLALGVYKPLEQIRNRRVAAIDTDRGLIATLSLADYPLRETQYVTADGRQRDTQDKYPSTRELLEIFKVRDGKVQRVEALSIFQPYGMPSPWSAP
jgi:hypothetical protein